MEIAEQIFKIIGKIPKKENLNLISTTGPL